MNLKPNCAVIVQEKLTILINLFDLNFSKLDQVASHMSDNGEACLLEAALLSGARLCLRQTGLVEKV